jgi:heme/copper-type cytochrome/quinol oxidase subunit 1
MKHRKRNRAISGAAVAVVILAGLVYLLAGIQGALLRAVTASTAAEQTLYLIAVVLGLVAVMPFLVALGGFGLLAAVFALRWLIRRVRQPAREVVALPVPAREPPSSRAA